MKRVVVAAMALAALALSTQSAQAGPYGDAFSKCLADSSSGKDRVMFVRWMFVALAAHPDLQSLSKVTPAEREGATRDMAGVVNRLILVDCRKEAVAVLQNEGELGFERGFESFGKLAAQELMGNPAVASSLEGFSQYMDAASWAALMKEANQGSKQRF
jgi:hypothetical protein